MLMGLALVPFSLKSGQMGVIAFTSGSLERITGFLNQNASISVLLSPLGIISTNPLVNLSDELNLTICHRARKKHANADTLSRISLVKEQEFTESVCCNGEPSSLPSVQRDNGCCL